MGNAGAAHAQGFTANGHGRIYTARRSTFPGETEFRLAEDALEIRDGDGAPRRFPYRDATLVRLSFDPTRVDRNRYRSDFRFRRGALIRIFSTSYVSFGEFEDRGATYAPFVRELVAQIAQAAPDCRFRAGKAPWVYLLEHGFLLTAFILLGGVLALIGGLPPFGIAAVKLAIIAFYVPVLIAYAGRNWPRRFLPADIPPAVLPAPAAG